MKKIILTLFFLISFLVFSSKNLYAQTPRVSPGITPSTTPFATASSAIVEKPEFTPTPVPRPDLTEKSDEAIEPLKKILNAQQLGSIYLNPVKYAIHASVEAGIPPNTIVLLLLLPGVAAFIAAARHLIGIRGFGIFLPAALSVVFVATGPIVGIGLFLIIVIVSTAIRLLLRRNKIKLQYLPRMAMLLHFVVLGILTVLFLTPLFGRPDLVNVSIFPVLILVLLAEDFSKVQLGKSVRVAASLTIETLILALVSYIFLNLKFIQEFALLRPEIWIVAIFIFDYLLGKYVGLRFLEFWRFRKIITK